MFNIHLCHSVQNKNNLNIQCPNKPKGNEILCGVHLKSKNLIHFNKNDTCVNKDINNKCLYSNDMCNKNEVKEDIYDKDQLLYNVSNNINMSVYSIRQSIKNCYLSKYINTKQSKPLLIEALKEKILEERYYKIRIPYIISIQKTFRRWIVYRRSLCYNDTDILTFTCKYEIPDQFFYMFHDTITKKRYAYDIRTLVQIINSEYPSCPYTFRPFTKEEKMLINLHKNKLILDGFTIEMEKITLTPEEEIDMKIKDLFYQVNMLDNYTNHEWFKNLNLFQLIDLYVKMEDIWNYRSNMDSNAKRRIVKDGAIFTTAIHIIKLQRQKMKMQNILLDEFNRLISEGIDREEKKLGAILLLTGLVEVSHDAAYALPHLVQI